MFETVERQALIGNLHGGFCWVFASVRRFAFWYRQVERDVDFQRGSVTRKMTSVSVVVGSVVVMLAVVTMLEVSALEQKKRVAIQRVATLCY